MSSHIKQDISIGENLKALRNKRRLSQEDVAIKLQTRRIPVIRETVSQMEAGRHSVRVSTLLVMAELYNAKFEDFFAGLNISEIID